MYGKEIWGAVGVSVYPKDVQGLRSEFWAGYSSSSTLVLEN